MQWPELAGPLFRWPRRPLRGPLPTISAQPLRRDSCSATRQPPLHPPFPKPQSCPFRHLQGLSAFQICDSCPGTVSSVCTGHSCWEDLRQCVWSGHCTVSLRFLGPIGAQAQCGGNSASPGPSQAPHCLLILSVFRSLPVTEGVFLTTLSMSFHYVCSVLLKMNLFMAVLGGRQCFLGSGPALLASQTPSGCRWLRS